MEGDKGSRGTASASFERNDNVQKNRKEYGGLKVDQAKRLKEMEKENARLKRLVAELSLDKQMLQEVAEGNF